MKTTFLLTNLFFCLLNAVTGQTKIPGFGEISMNELTMKECPFEKNASALNLVKTAKIEFNYNNISGVFSTKTAYSVRIKIFNNLGYEAANIKIPYLSNGRNSKVTDVEAYIYTLDSTGKTNKEKVGKKEIFKEKTDEKAALNYIAFTFPNIKAGAVIEYKYTRVEKNSLAIAPWFFQDEIPTLVSRVTAIVPTYVYMNYFLTANDPVELDSAYRKYEGGIYDEDTRSYTLKNIHSFKIEPLMTSVIDNIERVEFSLSQSGFMERQYTDVDKKMRMYSYDLLRYWYFGRQFAKPVSGTVQFIDSVKKLKNTIGKISATFNYVKKNVEWNGEQAFLCSDSVSGCWIKKSGSSAEMNILLINLLRKVDVECFPLLISTHENGRPDMNFASFSQFNGVDVLVKDSTTRYILDCTQKDLSFRIPPYNVLNSFGYVVDFDKMGWMLIVDNRILMKKEIHIDAIIDSNGNVKGTANSSLFGFAKAEVLKENKERKEKKTQKNNIISDNTPALIVDTAFFVNGEEDNDELVQKEIFHFKATSSGKFYFLNPFLFSDFRKNPFIDTLRFSDIDFGSNQSFFTQIRIKLPMNNSVEKLPKNISIHKNDSTISFERNVFVESNYLIIQNYFIIKKSIFIKEDYSNLKSFFDRFYKYLNEPIILQGKN